VKYTAQNAGTKRLLTPSLSYLRGGICCSDNTAESDDVVTTLTLLRYTIVKVLWIVYSLTARTRDVRGKFVAGIARMFGGEVTS
jgi:hypothetical protein